MPKPRIQIIFTGGTIGADVRHKDIADSGLRAAPFYRYFSDQFSRDPAGQTLLSAIDLPDFVTPVNKFSEDFAPGDWFVIGRAIHRILAEDPPDGVVIAHGTDTLSYTASALTFLLRGTPVPIIVTGSTLPLVHPQTDAVRNLYDALLIACDSRFRGVYVSFSGDPNQTSSVHLGTRTRKNSYPSPRFASLNSDPVARVRKSFTGRYQVVIDDPLVLNYVTRCNERQRLCEPVQVNDNVVFFQIYPGFPPSQIVTAVDDGTLGIILDLYNSGTGPTQRGKYSLLEAIQYATKKRVPVFATSQHLGSIEMNVYGSSIELRDAGVIPLRDMQHETAIAKLMWLRGTYPDKADFAKIQSLMSADVCGEITCTEP
jgi:L-asparaginase type I